MALRTKHDLYGVDLFGSRDDRWTDAFALGRLVLDVLGKRCLTCGRKLWSGRARLYCDSVCRNRHVRRRERFRKTLREMDQPCPFCHVEL